MEPQHLEMEPTHDHSHSTEVYSETDAFRQSDQMLSNADTEVRNTVLFSALGENCDEVWKLEGNEWTKCFYFYDCEVYHAHV